MSKRFLFPFTLLVMLLSAQPSWASVPCASWTEAEKSLRTAWAKGYPKEKMLSIEANGEPSSYTKEKSTGQTKIDEHGRTWEYYSKHTFCRVPAKAVVQQGANKRNFDVSAIYRKDGKKFVFEDIGVGESSAVAAAGQEAPSKDDIKKLVTALWLEKNPKTKVEKVGVAVPDLKTDSEKGRWWYSTGADIFIVDEEGQKKKCSNDYTTLYKGEKGMEGVDPSGAWKVSFLDDPSCN